MSQVGRIKVSLFRAHLLFEKFAYLFPFDVDGGQYDVARFEMHQLQDAFAQIGLYNIDAPLHQERIQSTLFGEHGFALDEMVDVMLIQYFVDDGAVFIGIFCPMYDGAVGGSILLKLQQKFFEVAVGV